MESRLSFKHNFLKQITFRMDYKGLLDSDIEKSVVHFRQTLYDKGFVNYRTRTENQIDLEMKIDLNLPEETPLSVSNTATSQVYVFQSDDFKKTVEISQSFMTLQVAVDSNYKGFDDYIELLVLLISSLKNQSPFFRAVRLGLRKINLCYVDSIECLKDYFVNGAFNIPETLSHMSQCSCKASNLLTILEKGAFNINYVRNLQEGIVQEDENQCTVYQTVLDIDVYCDDLKQIGFIIENQENLKSTLSEQNALAFECFVSSLTEEFTKKLQSEIFDDSHLREVI